MVKSIRRDRSNQSRGQTAHPEMSNVQDTKDPSIRHDAMDLAADLKWLEFNLWPGQIEVVVSVTD